MADDVTVTRTMGAPPAEVYEAWMDPEVVAQWFAPGPMTASVPEWDTRAGGRYRVEMHDPRGATHVASGTFQDLRPNERVVFTLAWEGQDMAETVVTIELRPAGDAGTLLTLVHSGLPTPQAREMHEHGWTGTVDKLAGRFPAAA